MRPMALRERFSLFNANKMRDIRFQVMEVGSDRGFREGSGKPAACGGVASSVLGGVGLRFAPAAS